MTFPNPSDKTINIQVGNETVVFSFPQNDHALFVMLGATLAQVQSFETFIAFLLSNFKAKDGKKMSSKKLEKLIRDNMNQTLGTLEIGFRKYVSNKEIADTLKTAKDKRNFFIHNILREYEWPFMSDENYLKAIEEIEQIRQLLANAEKTISSHLTNEKLLDLMIVEVIPETGEINILSAKEK